MITPPDRNGALRTSSPNPDQRLDTCLTLMAAITPDTTIDPTTGDGDHDRYAHICRKEDVTRAYITGEAIEALCGKKWVPTRDPDRYPVCPACKEAIGKIRNAGEN